MNNPKLVLIFNEVDAIRMNRGQLCAFAGHASMGFFDFATLQLNSITIDDERDIYSKQNISDRVFDGNLFIRWRNSGYRKIVLITGALLEEVYKKADRQNILAYLQYSSHDDKPKCLAIFGTDESLKEFTKGMELMK
jgi:peptidyl-tRNA hydrolase